MIIMNGICSMCDDGKQKRLFKRKPPLCAYHYKSENQKKRKPTGELAMFQEIWDSMKEHKSFINGENIPFFDVSCFAHVLSKAENKFPKFKLYKKCVVLITINQHTQWDKGLREDLRKLPEWDKMFKLEAELKEEYKLL